MDRRAATLLLLFAIATTLGTLSDLWAQRGYRIDRIRDEIVVDRQSDWNVWAFPIGTVDVSAGGVMPRRWQTQTDAVDDILSILRANPPDHLPGEITLLDAVDGGSNRAGVVHILDSKLDTYWEPDPLPEGAALANNWWFTVDLGRFVVIDRIVLRFVDEELGDPFLLFDVLTSDGQKPGNATHGESLEYLPVLELVTPNVSRREFVIDFGDAAVAARERSARFIQVVVRNSKHERGRRIDAAEYDRLRQAAPTDTGLVEYTKILREGTEVVVSRENFDLLPTDRRGPVHHFRRERPRLAFLEVWHGGENVASQILARGGTAGQEPPIPFSPDPMFDGDVLSTFPMIFENKSDMGAEVALVMDLGSFFWLDAMRVVQNLRGAGHNFSFGDHRLELSDGQRRIDGSVKWITVGRVEQVGRPKDWETSVNHGLEQHPTQTEYVFFTLAEPLKARFFRLVIERLAHHNLSRVLPGQYPVAEVQMFGAGFQPEVTGESPLIDTGGRRTLTSIEWTANEPPGTGVLLQTRTSHTSGEVTHYFNGLGEEVTQAWYEDKLRDPIKGVKLPENTVRGDIVIEEVMGADSSAWSAPYAVSGGRITSPSPRQFVQIRATLLSDSPDRAATLRNVRLNYTDPLARSFIGELTPSRVDSLAVVQPFSLYVRPQFDDGNPGFDGLLVTGPPGMELSFRRLAAGPEKELTTAAADAFMVEGAQPIKTATDSLLVAFPLLEPGDALELVRLDFDGRVFSVGGLLQAFARYQSDGDGTEPMWQQVDAGNATDAADEDGLLVIGVQSRRQLMTDFELPSVFTPNGDGANDEALLSFSVVLVDQSKRVSVSVYDLSGRLVRQLAERRDVSAGRYSIAWDGKDAAGKLVPPGVYAVRFHVDADDAGADLERQSVLHSIAVAY